ncbi:MAG: bifunctional riboflavin kinase/FAD synthetase [Acidobacteriota bacterium]
MRVWTGFDDLPRLARGTAVAIGNFDGLHLGHQEILRALVERARGSRLFSLLLTFSPHPERVLGRRRIATIQTLGQRLAGIRKWGVQGTLVLPFDRDLAHLSEEQFISQIIVSRLRAKELVVGENFRFGRGRSGDVETLGRAGRRMGFAVRPISVVVKNNRVVSSSLIRELLSAGRVDQAIAFLGRPYEIEGRVIKGAARGQTLGCPTANSRTDNEILPQGVFITEAETAGRTYPAVCNIGHRPTFGGDPLHLESFLLGFRGRLYGRQLRLRFFKKLRSEKKFPNAAALIVQIRRDAAAARAYFAR